MNKIFLICAIIFCSIVNAIAQKITIEINDGDNKICKSVILFSVIGVDTIEMKTVRNKIFQIDSIFFGKTFLLQYDSIFFNLGKLDTIVKGILVDYNQNARSNCFTLNKVYGDTVQSDFNASIGCQEFHNIFFYSRKPSKKEKAFEVRIKKKIE